MSTLKVNTIQNTSGVDIRGKIIQVVQSVKTDAFTMTGTTWTTPTGLSASITPTATTSRILILADIKVAGQVNATTSQTRIVRGSTPIQVGDAAGSRPQALTQNYFNAEGYHSPFGGGMYVDSPATTSSTTYSIQVKAESASTVYVNRTQNDRDSTADSRTASSIILLEIAG